MESFLHLFQGDELELKLLRSEVGRLKRVLSEKHASMDEITDVRAGLKLPDKGGNTTQTSVTEYSGINSTN